MSYQLYILCQCDLDVRLQSLVIEIRLPKQDKFNLVYLHIQI